MQRRLAPLDPRERACVRQPLNRAQAQPRTDALAGERMVSRTCWLVPACAGHAAGCWLGGTVRPTTRTDRTGAGPGEWISKAPVVQLAKAVFEGEPGGAGPRGDADLAVDRGEMGVHRFRAEEQLLGNPGVRQSQGDELQDFDLARTQAIR